MVIRRQLIPTEDRIMEVIARMLHIPSSNINPFTDLTDDLYLDDLDRSLLIANLERQFGVYLTQEQVSSIVTVRDASDLMQNHAA
ncbi:MAG: hypothetical protein H6555_07585 [Lewinellaceae bacterium]|nr:hypothetical protein [Lewinellaceae bacterium]